MKKLVSLFLVMIMVFQVAPISVLAEGTALRGVNSNILRSASTHSTVEWDVDGEKGSYVVEDDAGLLLSDILPASPAKEGYRFIGWVDAEGNPVNVSMPVTGDISVKAAFEEIVYQTVTFKAEDSDDVIITVEKGAAIGSKLPDDPVREGYRFDGWFAGETAVDAGTVVTDNMTVTAQFTELFTITFNGKDDAGEGQVYNYVVAKGETVGSIPAVPEKPGYTGVWAVNDVEVKADDIVTEVFTATPKYTEITYKVTYKFPDGTERVETIDFVNDGHAVPASKYPAVPKQENKEGKWVYEGTEAEFTVGTHLGGDVTVTTHYDQSIFTVKFVLVNADGTTTVHDTAKVYRGVAAGLPSDPVKVGATFDGWYTQPDGQGTKYTGTGENDGIYADTTLYAYFGKLVRVNFLVKDKDGNVVADKSQYFEVSAGSPLTTVPEDPFVPGRAFVKWVKDGSDPEEEVKVGTVVGNEDITAVAVFDDVNVYTSISTWMGIPALTLVKRLSI